MSDSDFPGRIETYRISARGVAPHYLPAAVRQAHALKIGGWIHDLADGAVEVLVQGSPDRVDLMLEWLRRGPPGAGVRDFASEELYLDKRYDRFERR
jgi:acylphosphatase